MPTTLFSRNMQYLFDAVNLQKKSFIWKIYVFFKFRRYKSNSLCLLKGRNILGRISCWTRYRNFQWINQLVALEKSTHILFQPSTSWYWVWFCCSCCCIFVVYLFCSFVHTNIHTLSIQVHSCVTHTHTHTRANEMCEIRFHFVGD